MQKGLACMGAGRWWKQELVKVFHLGIWVFWSFIYSVTSLASNTHIYPPGGGSASPAAQLLATPSPAFWDMLSPRGLSAGLFSRSPGFCRVLCCDCG